MIWFCIKTHRHTDTLADVSDITSLCRNRTLSLQPHSHLLHKPRSDAYVFTFRIFVFAVFQIKYLKKERRFVPSVSLAIGLVHTLTKIKLYLTLLFIESSLTEVEDIAPSVVFQAERFLPNSGSFLTLRVR